MSVNYTIKNMIIVSNVARLSNKAVLFSASKIPMLSIKIAINPIVWFSIILGLTL